MLRALRRLTGRRDTESVSQAPDPPRVQSPPGLMDIQHWRQVLPALHIEAPALSATRIAFQPAQREEALHRLRTEGYTQLDGLFDPVAIQQLRQAIESLHRQGWPPVFVFLYDEAWSLFQRLGPVFAGLLGAGFRQLPDLWAWRLEPATAQSGWKPHQDKGFQTLDPDRSPQSLTAWVALTEATPLNGCMYVLPADRDAAYGTGARRDSSLDLQSIRALPVPSGSLLLWTQALLHWGGRACGRASEARLSLSCEFQRGGIPAFNEPLMDPGVAPGFQHRLRLIALQARQYRGFQPLAPSLEALVSALA